MKTWESSIFFKTIAGSHLYGTNTATSDLDIRGVCAMPEESLIGLQPFEQFQPNSYTAYNPYTDRKESADYVIYGLNKFATLAMMCNPNIIEILFAPVDALTCLQCSPIWVKLIEIRSAFVSKKARHTFSGYAFSQLDKINRHHRWLTGKAPVEPHPEDYSAYQLPTGETKWRDEQQHQEYQTVHKQWRQYVDWQRDRNPARLELEKKYGYDTKCGLHLCRLMTQGEELLSTGKITLPRPDAKWLLEIKNGLMDYDQIIEWAANLDAKMSALEKTSPLPWGPDKATIEKVVMQINFLTLFGLRT